MRSARIDYRHIFRIFARHFSYMTSKTLFWIGCALAMAQLAISFLIPYLYQTLIAGMQAKVGFSGLFQSLFIPFMLLLMIAPLICLGMYWQRSAANKAAANMQKDVNAHIIDMPVSSLETDLADKLLRATQNAPNAAGMLGGHLLQKVFKFVVFTGGALIMLLWADYRFALIGVAFSAAMFALSTFLNSRLRALESMALSADSTAAGHLMQMIANLPIVKIYRLESYLEGDFKEASMNAYTKRLTYMRLRGGLDGGMDALYYAIQPLAIIIGVNALAQDAMPFARLVYIAGLLNVMLNGMHELGYFIQLIQKRIVNAERTYDLLDEPPERDYERISHCDLGSDCAVEFHNVNFGYTVDTSTLQDINLRLERGKHIAIVGPSGCGKSTLLKLILRFYEPDSGEIILYNTPISKLDNHTLRHLSAYIPQDSGLFDGTIADNIMLGNAGCSKAQMFKAMKDAALFDYVESLPLKENAPIGEGGSLLSGGQGQRIAVARALLKEAPLILMDEATSALDVDTESEIHRALAHAAAGKTILCVTHRLSTIVDFDSIIFMENGAIAEMGTHDELMHKKGAYYSMYNSMTQ